MLVHRRENRSNASSAPFQRSYSRIAQKLKDDLGALKAPCDYVEDTSTINGDSTTVVFDPLLGADHFYCSGLVGTGIIKQLPSRQSCLADYPGTIEPPLINDNPLPLNYLSRCNKTGTTIQCTRTYRIYNPKLTYSFTSNFMGQTSDRAFTCKQDQLMWINHTTKQSKCVNWADMPADVVSAP